jgi:hypothetical protein
MRCVLSLLSAALVLMFAPALAQAKILIEVDKSTQEMVVSVDGEPRHRWPVSTGRLAHDTPEGNYRAFRLERDHFSKEWDDAPMPHSIFFTKRGHAIHGSFDVKRIGTPASAGCVRLDPKNAERLFALVEERGVLNTTVVITGDVQVALARQNRNTARATPERRQAAPARSARSNRTYQREELDSYAQQMRRRYYEERPRAVYPYVERRTYAQPRYYEPPAYYYYDQYGRAYRGQRYRPYGWD